MEVVEGLAEDETDEDEDGDGEVKGDLVEHAVPVGGNALRDEGVSTRRTGGRGEKEDEPQPIRAARKSKDQGTE